MTRDDLDEMTRHYVAALLWAETDESDESGGRPLDESFSVADILDGGPAETAERVRADCAAFYDANAADLSDIPAESAGHDFWLTRCHHGAGFWDRGLGDVGERLTASAHGFGECWPYIGDDGLLYLA